MSSFMQMFQFKIFHAQVLKLSSLLKTGICVNDTTLSRPSEAYSLV